MIKKNEQQLLLSIRTIPLVLFIIIALIGVLAAISYNKIQFNEEILKIKDQYIQEEKYIVKNEVLKIHDNIINEQQLTKEKLKKNLQEKVYIAHTIATNIYEKYKNIKSQQEIIELIKNALVNIRFNNGRGYFFIYSLDYECILFPLNRKIEGRNFYNFQDGKGIYLTREIIKQVKKEDEGFLTWWYHKPSDMKQQFQKLGFNKKFEPYNWFIGTGEYITDFEESVKKSISTRLSTYTYGNDYYFFIFDKDGNVLTHKDTQEIGKNISKVKDADGNYIANDIFKTANEGGGFVKYSYIDHITKSDKLSYVKKLDNWEWTIGSGFHKDDLMEIVKNKKIELKEKNQNQIDTILMISFFVIVIVILLSTFLSYLIQKQFESYTNKVRAQDKLLSEQSKLAAMGEMLGNIAHQWRQPLSIISTGATGMQAQKEYGLLNDEQFNKTCNIINDNAQYLSKTIDDFKNFIKGDRVKEVFTLEENINSFIHLVEGSIKTYNIKLILNLEKGLKINGYTNELIQCFINIFNNSKDVLKNIDEENRLIIITSYTKENNIIIKIQDNGKGINENIISKVFEPYFTTKHKSQGTGLGLHMTYKFIVDGMKGTIFVKNKKFVHNQKHFIGALFTITLPKN